MSPPSLHPLQTADYLWVAVDRSGQQQQGSIQASGETHARALLRRQGLQLTQLKKQRKRLASRIKPQDIARFTRQWATMMKAGVPLLQALAITAQAPDKPALAALIRSIQQDLESGLPLAQAFRRHPQHFDDLYGHLVQAGERAGVLDLMLARMADHMEKILALKARIRSAMSYPLSVLGVAVIVLTVIMLWVIPQFQHVFALMGSALPWPTEMVIATSRFLTERGPLILAGLALPVLLAMRAKPWRGPRRLGLDRWLLRLPMIGGIVQKAGIARWTRTLATMLGAGVPMDEALDSVAKACNNLVFTQATQAISQKVHTGHLLSAAMRGTQLFPPLVLQMCQVGEESGALDDMLHKVADFCDSEVNEAIARAMPLIEPLMFVILGGLIGSVLLALYLPIFQMGQPAF